MLQAVKIHRETVQDTCPPAQTVSCHGSIGKRTGVVAHETDWSLDGLKNALKLSSWSLDDKLSVQKPKSPVKRIAFWPFARCSPGNPPVYPTCSNEHSHFLEA